MTTNTPTTFDPDAAIVAATWSAATPYLTDPPSDDAPVPDRLRAVRLAVLRAREQRRTFGEIPAGLASLVDLFDEAVRRARPEVNIVRPARPAPIFHARILTALASTSAQTARMTPAQVAAADAICAGTPHADLLAALHDAERAFTAALEAEVDSIPRDELDRLAGLVDERAIERQTDALRDEPLVPRAEINGVRVPAGSPS